MWTIGSERYFAIKESVAEFYRREFSAGRFPIALEKGTLTELYCADLVTENQLNAWTAIEAKNSKSGLVAVISVTGIMTRYGEACSYGTESIIQQINAANADERIVAIVMKWDTPGGAVNGTKALSLSIKNSAKVVVSFVIQANSAGFWGMVYSRETFIEDSAQSEVGSIGVYATHIDERAKLEKEGIKVLIIRAEGSEDKARMNPYEDLPAEVLAEKQSTVTDIRKEFVDMVQEARPAISEEVFSGKTYRKKDAVRLNMVDKIGSLQDAISRADFLSRKDVRQQNSNSNNNANEMGFFKEIFANNKPADATAAEALAESAVAKKDEQIANLQKKVDELSNSESILNAKIMDFEPKAKQYDEIKDEHEVNKSYVQNLISAGIKPPTNGADANTLGEQKTKRRSYEEAPWNEKAVELRSK